MFKRLRSSELSEKSFIEIITVQIQTDFLYYLNKRNDFR